MEYSRCFVWLSLVRTKRLSLVWLAGVTEHVVVRARGLIRPVVDVQQLTFI
jgi:hypothetical protein